MINYINDIIYFERLSYVAAFDLTITAFQKFGGDKSRAINAINTIINEAIEKDLFTYVTIGAESEEKRYNRTIKGNKNKWRKRINRQVSIEIQNHVFPPIDGLYSESIYMSNIYEMITAKNEKTIIRYKDTDTINQKIEKELILVNRYSDIINLLKEKLAFPKSTDLFLNNYRIPLNDTVDKKYIMNSRESFRKRASYLNYRYIDFVGINLPNTWKEDRNKLNDWLLKTKDNIINSELSNKEGYFNRIVFDTALYIDNSSPNINKTLRFYENYKI